MSAGILLITGVLIVSCDLFFPEEGAGPITVNVVHDIGSDQSVRGTITLVYGPIDASPDGEETFSIEELPYTFRIESPTPVDRDSADYRIENRIFDLWGNRLNGFSSAGSNTPEPRGSGETTISVNVPTLVPYDLTLEDGGIGGIDYLIIEYGKIGAASPVQTEQINSPAFPFNYSIPQFARPDPWYIEVDAYDVGDVLIGTRRLEYDDSPLSKDVTVQLFTSLKAP